MKNKKFYIGALLTTLAVSLTFGLFGMANTRAYAEESNFNAVSVTLDQDVKVNVKVTAPEGYTTAKIDFALADATESVTADVVDGSAVVTSGLVTPLYMNEALSMTLTLSGEGQDDIVEEKNDFTLKSYLNNLLSSSALTLKQTETQNAFMDALVVDILNYGAEAQKYVASKTGAEVGTLATDGLTAEQLALATDYSAIAPEKSDLAIVGGDATAIEYKKAGLIFDHNVALYVNFARSTVDGLTVKVTNDGKVTEITEFTPVGNTYSFVYDDISATQFDNVLTIQAYDGETAIGGELTYSVASYVYSMQDDAEIGALAKATYAYGYAAKEFKNADLVYPTQGVTEENVLYKGSTAYSFMAVAADGNTSRTAEKGWFTPNTTHAPNGGLPTVMNAGEEDQYLQFTKTSQIELFFNKGSEGNTYHIFDNNTNWKPAEAQALFYKEYTYDFEVSANGAFMLGVCDFKTNTGVFADKSDLYGIQFLFDGNTVKMSRCQSGNVEAIATVDGVNFGDGTTRKISFAIVRKELNDGQIRVFVDEQKVMFEATADYGSTTVSTNPTPGGTVVNGTLNFPDCSKYGQRFTVAPQALGEGYATVNIYSYKKTFVMNYDNKKQCTVTLDGGLKFKDGTTSKVVDQYYDVFANVDLTGYQGLYNVDTGKVFNGLIAGDITLGGYAQDENAVDLTLQQFATKQEPGLASSVTKDKDYIIAGRKGMRATYTKEFTPNYIIRFCNPLAGGAGVEAGVTYVSTYAIKNHSSNAIHFDLYEINQGHTLTEFKQEVNLAPGESITFTLEWSFSKANNNMMAFLVFSAHNTEAIPGFDFGIAISVVKK